jgi:hypothetical protein
MAELETSLAENKASPPSKWLKNCIFLGAALMRVVFLPSIHGCTDNKTQVGKYWSGKHRGGGKFQRQWAKWKEKRPVENKRVK